MGECKWEVGGGEGLKVFPTHRKIKIKFRTRGNEGCGQLGLAVMSSILVDYYFH